MRFSITSLLALAAGATAIEAVTETVTMYTTYCPEATSIVHSGTTYSISTPGHLTMTGGHYTVTRPLLTSTVVECKKCSSSTPLPSTPVVSVSPSASASATLASTPYVPSGAAATGVPGTSAGSSGASPATTSQPAYNAGAANVAGAGAGLAAVFGAVALLL
ncbi:uncharacterized protein N7484_010689 [Penicillium longicatenatum]|uniref:uncharacterized protein n=1 Tax=Penicillium longicatenatum TaxID=1561947 RepID=UPI00254743E1|nr:uncharacterized protein N7484_010689 [Penicillium longicatenatum]KAJ5630589.1 hypothetical protein N7484_010689 [Penicillium longicatenatum]KAJ5660234.1 hypothetical protein N7507_006685 [Penicillium longicatenatum]